MRGEGHGDWVICRKMQKIMFKNSAENKAVFCSLVSTARLACCSSGYHHAAKMCLAEKVTFEQFLSRFFIPEWQSLLPGHNGSSFSSVQVFCFNNWREGFHFPLFVAVNAALKPFLWDFTHNAVKKEIEIRKKNDFIRTKINGHINKYKYNE